MDELDDWFRAAATGDVYTLENMLKKGENVDRVDEKHGSTALMFAAQAGDKEAVELLLNSGADINARNSPYGNTPLMYAVKSNHKETMKSLLEAGADPNMKNVDGEGALHEAVIHGYPDIIKLLLDFGVDVDSQTSRGNTSLLLASDLGYQNGVKILLDAGANPNILNGMNFSPLSYTQNTGIAKLLLEAGADSFTPLYKTSSGVEKLIEEENWKRLYARDLDTAGRYAKSTVLPKDVWQLILLNKRQQQLCQNLNSNKNKEVLKYFALELDIPITRDMSKGQLCALISRQLAYGLVYKGEAERDMQKVRQQVKQTAFQFGLNPDLPTDELLKQLSYLFE